MAKNQDGFIVFDDLDPVTAEVIGQGRQRQNHRGKSHRAQRQARIDALRSTRKIDIPADLDEHLTSIAGDLSVSVSQLINRLIWEGLEHLTIDQLRGELEPTRSMRYYYALPYPGNKRKGNIK